MPTYPLIDLQNALSDNADTLNAMLPSEADFQRWAHAALVQAAAHNSEQFVLSAATEITVRVVDAEESRALNCEYRSKDTPTNVLSFPSDLPDFLRAQLPVLPLGDLAICASVMQAEAVAQQKTLPSHWAHLTVHGVLHLLGFDHIDDADAAVMERLEIAALHTLGMTNPYEHD